jgi:hypothetical protein
VIAPCGIDIEARLSHVAATEIDGTHATNIPAIAAARAIRVGLMRRSVTPNLRSYLVVVTYPLTFVLRSSTFAPRPSLFPLLTFDLCRLPFDLSGTLLRCQ